MKIGPAGYTVAPARAIAVQGPLFPWQTQYRIAKQEQVDSPWLNQLVRSDMETGWRLFTMEPQQESYWFELDIRPLGTEIFGDSVNPVVDLPTAVPTVDDVAGSRAQLRTWTPAKARVLYPLAGGTMRELRFDINTGVTVAIPPTNKVEVDLLVWADEGIDDIPSPNGDANAFRGVRFATLVSCKATLVQYANPVAKPRWTQLVYINPASANRGTSQIPLIENAGTVVIDAGAVDPGINLAPGDVRAFMRNEFVVTPPTVLPDVLSVSSAQFPIDFDTGHNSKHVPIPGSQANVVRVEALNAGVSEFNAAVIQEIYC